MKTIQVKKGQFLQRKGDTITYVYVVKSGLLKSYSIDEKGKEHIFMFAPEGWIVADAIESGHPSQLFIQALENSIVVQRKKDSSTEGSNEKLINRLRTLQQRIIMLMSATAIERYEHFLETYPDIVQRVPQRMIASYLGITPEALSAAKRKHYTK